MSDHEWCRDLAAARELVAAANRGLVRLAAELEAAIRERDEARARVAELEAAPPPRGWLTERESAAVTDGGPDATAGPVAWALAYAVCGRGGRVCDVKVSREEAEDMQREFAFETELVPLYNAPQRPRSWLTAAERAQVQRARDELLSGTVGYESEFANEKRRRAGVLTDLLARETPPKVKVPSRHVIITTVDARERIDRQWHAAIRAAGGEVDG